MNKSFFILIWIVLELGVWSHAACGAGNIAVWLKCFGRAKEHVKSESQKEIVASFSSCSSSPDGLKLFVGQTLDNPVCGTWENLSPSCKDLVERCTLNRADCEAALDTVISCVPWTAAISAMLENVGVESARVLTKLLANYGHKAAECRELDIPPFPEPPIFYRRYCQDSGFSVNFYQLNDLYYDVKNPETRARLLSGYAREPLGEGFQRTVVTAMAMDSLASKSTIERAAAAQVLGTQGDFSAVSLYSLVNAAMDKKALVRKEAAKSLRLQGNRGFLTNALLIQMVLNETDPDLRAEAALALREQAVLKSCPEIGGMSGDKYESLFYVPATLDPRSLQYTVPVCVKYNANKFPKPTEERAFLGKTFGCPDVPVVAANAFDALTDLNDIREFNIVANRCAVMVPLHETRVLNLARLAVIVAQAEMNETKPREIAAKAKMLASLRTLGVGDNVALEILYDAAVQGKHPDIRAGALFALAQVGKNSARALRAYRAALADKSPLVRRVALGAIGENMIFDITQDQQNMMHYRSGVAIIDRAFKGCATIDQIGIQPSDLPPNVLTQPNIKKYMEAGAERAKTLKRDLCETQKTASYPGLMMSNPRNGENGFEGPEFTLLFNTRFDPAALKQAITVFSSDLIPFNTFDVEEHGETGTDRWVTKVTFTLGGNLIPGLLATIRIDENLKNTDGKTLIKYPGPQGTGRRVAFQLASREADNLAGEVIESMTKDSDPDVRFSAAGLLLPYQTPEPAVFDFLKASLATRPSDVVFRASRFFKPELFKYRFAQQTPEANERAKFLDSLMNYLIADISRFEKPAPDASIKSPDDFLEIPAISGQFEVLQDLFARGMVPKAKLLSLLEGESGGVAFDKWIWKHIAYTAPLATAEARYPLYHRFYWAEARPLWVDLYDKQLATKETGLALDQLHGVVVKPGEGTVE